MGKKILLSVFIFTCFFLFASRFRKQPTLISEKGNEVKKTLPHLYVKGNAIYRADTNKPVILKGVSTMAFVSSYFPSQDLVSRLNTVKSWKINLVGIFLNPLRMEDQWLTLDKVIGWAKNNHCYIYLMPALDIQNTSYSWGEQVELFRQLLSTASARYAKENHVMYGLWAEPRNIPWVGWVTIAKKWAKIVRSNAPQAVILMTGIQYGRFVYDKNLFNLDNIIYDFHDYPWSDAVEAREGVNLPHEFLWKKTKTDYPILIGEFGGVYAEDFGSDEDIGYIEKVLYEAEKDKLHYTAYSIDDIGEQGLYDWKNNIPTRKGKIIKNNLLQNIPTQF